MSNYHLVVNPSSGGGSASAIGIDVARRLRDAGAQASLTYSPGEDLCPPIVTEAINRGQVIVAVGGDGMLASVAGTVIDAGGTLGIVPAGRGNDFARQLGIPRDPAAATTLLLQGSSRPVDVIDVGGRVVLGSVYAGIDSLASEYVNAAHWLPRPVQYPYAAVRAILAARPMAATLVVDGAVTTVDAYSIVIANSGFYGSGMHVAPSALPDDGELQVVVIEAMPKRVLLGAMRRLYDGSHIDLPGVRVIKGRHVELRASTRVVAYGDGERLRELPVTATVRPGVLDVLRP